MKRLPGVRFSTRSVRCAVLLVSVVAAAALAQTARATTLSGETFSAVAPSPTDVLTATCGASLSDPITYHAEGTAGGPHQGRFVEDGTVVPDPDGTGIVSLDATFTITSPASNVTGEKHLVAPGTGTAFCNRDFAGAVFADLCYRAEFADGSSETGRSALVLNLNFDRDLSSLLEEFTPDTTVSCGCPDDSDADSDGLTDNRESLFSTLLGNPEPTSTGSKTATTTRTETARTTRTKTTMTTATVPTRTVTATAKTTKTRTTTKTTTKAKPSVSGQ